MGRSGIRIREVADGSIGQQAGLCQGDEILAINGNLIPDELALRFHLAQESVEIEVRRASGMEERLALELPEGESVGIEVEDFRTRTCNNSCLFCFIDQLPPGVRPSLRVKDDDYRLSFLHGNYITLTNLPERELDRIIEQKLSPLYVSVHATDPELRTRMLGRRKADDLDRKMRKLIAGGITLHAQIVLMPGINDGVNLETSVNALYGYYPGVDSIAIVPLGLSDHGSPKDRFAPVTAAYCRQIIRQAEPWQKRFRGRIGRTFAYLADEFYIQGSLPIPETLYYDDFAQIEDGVGMVRRFLNDFETQLPRWRKPRPHLEGTLITARLFHPFLEDCIGRFNGRFDSKLQVRVVENRFMGRNITVAGLLAGQDILSALAGHSIGNFLIIPQEAISRAEGILVDNLSPAELSRRLGRPVFPSGRAMNDFFRLLCSEL